MYCIKCDCFLTSLTAYEYRGAISCSGCFDEVCKDRDYQRSEIIIENQGKTELLRGLDLSDSEIGKANQELLKTRIALCKKESMREKIYRGEV